ncbi:hypothetical protein F7R91_14665 [Streptomyces luteolifulvus]|uniref:Uncharacterized protein n=1 Tax=Streptomyces luteolifulvus TaxID=2615112 RepID=A0A6H9V3P3_9ACTN|nr:hypothetical protein [Streptomyces luteolifulvus]KAB1146817.1 hypothetical protein F7R91_14665 [Streptomyces luteolifulvus]
MTGKPSPKRTEDREDRQAPVTFSPYLMRRHTEQLAGWLHANGVDPDDVAIDHPISVVDGVIHYHAADLDRSGESTDDSEVDEAITVERTARCVEPAPDLSQAGPQAS